jgi:hypothetical protein
MPEIECRKGEAVKKRNCLMMIGILLLSLLGMQLAAIAEAVTLEVLNPRGEIPPPKVFAPSPRVSDLAGKKIGIYWNGKQGGPNFWDVVEEQLKKRFPTATVVRRFGASDLGDTLAAKLAKEVDVFIYGVGD